MIADFFEYLSTTNYHRIAFALTALCVCIGLGVGFPVIASQAKNSADEDETRVFTVFSKWQMEVTTRFSSARALAGSLASFASALAVRPANMSAPPAQRMDILDPVAFRRTAANLFRDVPGVTSLILCSGGVLSQSLSTRVSNFGYDLYNTVAYHDLFNKMMVDGLPAGFGPNPIQSRPGIAVYSFYPVFVSNVTSPSNFWGGTLVTTEIADLLAAMNISRLTDVDNMEYALWYEQTAGGAAGSQLKVVATSDPSMTDTVIAEGKRMRLPVGEVGKVSYLGIYPRGGPVSAAVKSRDMIVIILATFFISAAVALSIYSVLFALFAYRHRHAPSEPNSRQSEKTLEVDKETTTTVQVSANPTHAPVPLNSTLSSSFIYFAVISLRGAQPIFERAPLDALRMFTHFISRVRSEAEANNCYTMCEIGDRSVYVVAESAENILQFARRCAEGMSLTVFGEGEDGPTSRRGIAALTLMKGGDATKAGEGLGLRDLSESDAASSYNKSSRSVSKARSYGNNNTNNTAVKNGGATALNRAISREISVVSARAMSTSAANDRAVESFSQSQSQFKKNNDHNTTDDEATRRTSKLCQVTSSSFISTAVCQPSVTVHAVPHTRVRITKAPPTNNNNNTKKNAQGGSDERNASVVAAYTRLYDATRDVYFFSAGESALATLCSTVDEARSGEVALTVDMQSAAPDACEALAESALASHFISTEKDLDNNHKCAKETKNMNNNSNNDTNSPAVRVLRWTPETGAERDDEDPSVAMVSITDVYLKRMMVLADRNRKQNNSKHAATSNKRGGGGKGGGLFSRVGEEGDNGSSGKHSGSGSASNNNNNATTITRSASILYIYFSPAMFTTHRAAALLDTVRRIVGREKGAVVSANGSTVVAAFNLLAAGGHHQIRAANCVLALREAIPFSVCPFVCSLHHGKVSALVADGLVMCTGPTVATSYDLLSRAIALLEKTDTNRQHSKFLSKSVALENLQNNSEDHHQHVFALNPRRDHEHDPAVLGSRAALPVVGTLTASSPSGGVCTLPLADVHGLCVLFCAAEMSSAFECEAIDVESSVEDNTNKNTTTCTTQQTTQNNEVQMGTAAAASTLNQHTRRRVMYRLAHRKTTDAKDDEWMYRLKNDEDDGVFSRVNTVFTLVAEGRLEEAREMWANANNELVGSGSSVIAMRQLSRLLLKA